MREHIEEHGGVAVCGLFCSAFCELRLAKAQECSVMVETNYVPMLCQMISQCSNVWAAPSSQLQLEAIVCQHYNSAIVLPRCPGNGSMMNTNFSGCVRQMYTLCFQHEQVCVFRPSRQSRHLNGAFVGQAWS